MADTRVLLVDDDEIARMGLSFLLDQSGFTVTSARNVPEALKYRTSETFDALLTDLHMSGAGDGLTVVSRQAARQSHGCDFAVKRVSRDDCRRHDHCR